MHSYYHSLAIINDLVITITVIITSLTDIR
jgi:hypothetical protein